MRFLRIFAVFMIMTSAGYAEKVEFFEKIEFRGVINADRYRIVQSSRAKGSSKGIIIDTDSLKDVLGSHPMIKTYNLEREGSALIVEVEEKYPLFMTMIVDKQQSIPTLADEKMNIIETGFFFRTDMPIIILQKEYTETGDGFESVTSLFELLKRVRSEKGGFMNEIEEIKIDTPSDLKVKLRKRKTLFVIKNELNGFTRLEKTAAYLDAALRYPEFLDLRGNMVLVR